MKVLTREARHQIHHLKSAAFSLKAAQDQIKQALGDTDVGHDYQIAIEGMLEDIELDIADIWTRNEQGE